MPGCNDTASPASAASVRDVASGHDRQRNRDSFPGVVGRVCADRLQKKSSASEKDCTREHSHGAFGNTRIFAIMPPSS